MHPNSRRYFQSIRAQYEATDAQKDFVRSLLNKCSFNFYAHVGYSIPKALDAYAGARRISKSEASKDIEFLKGVLEKAKQMKEAETKLSNSGVKNV